VIALHVDVLYAVPADVVSAGRHESMLNGRVFWGRTLLFRGTPWWRVVFFLLEAYMGRIPHGLGHLEVVIKPSRRGVLFSPWDSDKEMKRDKNSKTTTARLDVPGDSAINPEREICTAVPGPAEPWEQCKEVGMDLRWKGGLSGMGPGDEMEGIHSANTTRPDWLVWFVGNSGANNRR
jgi:hypothetical protein